MACSKSQAPTGSGVGNDELRIPEDIRSDGLHLSNFLSIFERTRHLNHGDGVADLSLCETSVTDLFCQSHSVAGKYD